MTKEMIDDAAKELTVGIKQIYGDKLKGVILFGSCARGDFESDSDVDIMILLDVPKEDVPIERQKIRAIISSLDEKYEYALLISPVIRSYDEFNKWEKVVPFIVLSAVIMSVISGLFCLISPCFFSLADFLYSKCTHDRGNTYLTPSLWTF